MSKADEKSKQYRDFREQCGIKDPVMLIEIEEAYYQGYHQAEKDLELSWKDMFDIFRLVNEVLDDYSEGKTKKEVGEEVLKRFLKERKEKCQ